MAESPLERLKRLAKEKKEAAASVVAAPVTQPEVIKSVGLAETKVAILRMQLMAEDTGDGNQASGGLESSAPENAGSGVSLEQTSNGGELNPDQPGERTLGSEAGSSVAENSPLDPTSSNNNSSSLSSSSKHPLAMEFAELEQALLTKDPSFKTILRQVHRHLATDPDLVTQMTEAEIQSIVSGLVVMANAEVVEPAKAKTLKAKVAAAKKATIDVDDL